MKYQHEEEEKSRKTVNVTGIRSEKHLDELMTMMITHMSQKTITATRNRITTKRSYQPPLINVERKISSLLRKREREHKKIYKQMKRRRRQDFRRKRQMCAKSHQNEEISGYQQNSIHSIQQPQQISASTTTALSDFFCLTYSWSKQKLIPLLTVDEYYQSILNLQQLGYNKRSECYLDHVLKFPSQKTNAITDGQIVDRSQGQSYKATYYYVYMVSYGDCRPKNFIYGECPLSSYFGVCMFDYVYMFLEREQLVIICCYRGIEYMGV